MLTDCSYILFYLTLLHYVPHSDTGVLPIQLVLTVYDCQISYLLHDSLTPAQSHLSKLASQILFYALKKKSQSYLTVEV